MEWHQLPKMKRALIFSTIIAVSAWSVWYIFYAAFKRTENCAMHTKMNQRIVISKVISAKTVPDYISSHPDLTGKDFSDYITDLSYQEKVYILNDLSLWKKGIDDPDSDSAEIIGVYAMCQGKVFGFRLSGVYERTVDVGSLLHKYTSPENMESK